MKLHIITIGKPKLPYARLAWEEYAHRMQRFHEVKVTHIADKFGHDAEKILETAGKSYKVVLEINGKQLDSPRLADFIKQRELEAREVCFIIGGPDGLPEKIITAADFQWSLSKLTFPHDLAMVVLLESLYRASAINAGHPYHR